jgi:2-phosphoglycerate kinase
VPAFPDRTGPVPNWRVLLVGGSSGVGKSRAADTLGRRLGIPWFQVDDLRLAFQRSRPRLPGGGEWALDYFEDPSRWRDPEAGCGALIAICEVLTPAVEIVVENHVAIRAPLILEGDGIHPAVLDRPSVRDLAAAGLVRALFLVEPDESAVLANMAAREREDGARTPDQLPGWARISWLHGQWLQAEATRRALPVLRSRPWDTLVDRILAAAP